MRFPFTLFPLLLAANLSAQTPIAPNTNVLRLTGYGASVASHGSDVVALWSNNETRRLLLTRMDPSGAPVEESGTPLPTHFYWFGIGWGGHDFVVAGGDSIRGVTATAIAPDGRIVIEPRTIAADFTAAHITVTSNGSSVLVTYVTQTIVTQTLWGVLLDLDLNVLREKFAIDTREVDASTNPAAVPSIATDGVDYLAAWENHEAPETLTLKLVTGAGEVMTGATVASEQPILMPQIAAGALVWWDRTNLRALRLGAQATPLGEPISLQAAENVKTIAIAGDASTFAVAWVQSPGESCDGAIFARRFDAALQPLGSADVLDENAGAIALVDVTIANGSAVAVWQHADCEVSDVVRSGEIGGPARSIVSRSFGPSVQTSPDVATDGNALVAVWEEQRGDDTRPRIYSTALDADGKPLGTLPAALSEDRLSQRPRIAAGGGRWLAVWDDGAVKGRFVRADGTPDGAILTIGSGSAPRVVWDGSRFVIVYREGSGVRAAEVELSGNVRRLDFTSEDTEGAVTDLVAGAGEVMVLVRTESAERVTVRTIALRGSRWDTPTILATVKRPCPHLGCTDYLPVAIGWDGVHYLALFVESGGPGRGGFLRSARVAADGTLLDEIPPSRASLLQPLSLSGRLLWNGTEYLFPVNARDITSYWANLYALRVASDGTMNRGFSLTLKPVARGTFDAELQSAFGAVLVSPTRALLVYAKNNPLSRVFSQTTDITTPSKRRSVR